MNEISRKKVVQRLRKEYHLIVKYVCLICLVYFVFFFLYLNIYFDFETAIINENDDASFLLESKFVNNYKLNLLFINNNNNSDNENVSTSDIDNHFNNCYLEADSCFNIYQCDSSVRLKVYVYERTNSSLKFSHEFKEYIGAIIASDYYEANPERACLFVPLIDLLNYNNLNMKLVENELNNLEL
jgi:hypothetical protein